jgi:IclR family pca regulon transcriptional regulator
MPPTSADPAATPASPAAPRPGDGYVQSFARGLAVIRSFSAAAPHQTLSDVARSTGLTRAGARRILLTLQALGYVQADGRRFGLTPRILDLGFAYLSSLPLWNLAEPVMEALVEDVKESCSAAVLDGADIVYVLRVPTHKIMSITLGTGSRLPAHCTSMGRVLLAALPPDELQALLRRHPPVARTARTLVEPSAWLAELARVRAQGWALVDQELEEGLVSLAVPVRDRAGRAIAAMNISGQVNRSAPALLLQQVLPKLQAAARQIEAMLQKKA